MSLEDDIHHLVLGMDGVATVYSADPLWLNALKQLGALLGPNGEPAPVPFVVCTEEIYDAGTAGSGAAAASRAVMSVRVRIGTDGSVPAPATARSVAALIRAHVAARRADVDVRAVVQIAAIGS